MQVFSFIVQPSVSEEDRLITWTKISAVSRVVQSVVTKELQMLQNEAQVLEQGLKRHCHRVS